MSDIIIQTSLADKVYDAVKSQILSGELTGGMAIPEETLGQRFGVSRTPIREALRRLAEYGLVVIKPRCNATVYSIDAKEAGDIARVRLALEQLAADATEASAVGARLERLSRLAADCQYSLGVGDRAALFEQDSRFHLELVKCAENAPLYELYERLDAKVQLLRIAQNLDDARLAATIAQHIKLIKLLQGGDRDACKELLREHILHEAL